jgi:hypothetical protein
MGHRLVVVACPFIEQDQQVMACASASLWMATTPVSMKDEHSQGHSTAEITRLANGMQRGYSPTIGGAGLSYDQMSHALIEMGYDPFGLEWPEPGSLKKIIAAYSDSGFAPLLIVRLDDDPSIPKGSVHVVTVVGHLDGAGQYMLKRGESEISELPEHVKDLIIHDDQQGLYLQADIGPHGKGKWSRVDFIHRTREGRLGGRIISIMIPIPNRIMTDVVAVISLAETRLKFAREGRLPDRSVRIRPVLARSRDYKEALPQSMPDELKRLYRRLPMPRYVWLVEFSFVDEQGSSSQKVFGELLIDSTSPTLSRTDFLSEHFPGSVAGTAISGHDFEPFNLPVPEARYEAFHPRV